MLHLMTLGYSYLTAHSLVKWSSSMRISFLLICGACTPSKELLCYALLFQMEYAARDSQAGLAIFLCLVSLKLQATPSNESREALLAALQKRSLPMCHGIINVAYRVNPVSATINLLIC